MSAALFPLSFLKPNGLDALRVKAVPATFVLPPLPREPRAIPSAVIYCEGNFTGVDGKTANGLVRHSEAYEILAVIDSQKAGLDAGDALGGQSNGIPVCRDLAEVPSVAGVMPDYFIYGMAPASGMLSAHERSVVLSAIKLGMNVVSGLHISLQIIYG